MSSVRLLIARFGAGFIACTIVASAVAYGQKQANVGPSVSLTSPANGATYNAPATITLSASATDSDGSIRKVEFMAGGSVIGTVTTAPYNFTWSNVAAGSYSLTARATDNRKAKTVSNAVTVTVKVPTTIDP